MFAYLHSNPAESIYTTLLYALLAYRMNETTSATNIYIYIYRLPY